MKAYKKLVNRAIELNFVVSVFDGEYWPVKKSTNKKDIFEAIESVEVAQLKFRNSDGISVGWALVSPFGVADDETVIDHTVTDWINDCLA